MLAPKHVAIIMDGNGRWANERCHSRVWGHIRGSRIVSKIVEEADDIGVKNLTLYAFSTENWSRPISEIETLFKLLKKFILIEKRRILSNNIRFKVIGDTAALPAETKALINNLEQESKSNTGLSLTFAFGYGGRKEIVDAVNKIRLEKPDQEITESLIQEYLYEPSLGDVDLLIRTGGNSRISNFLLWQAAYAEIFVTETKWPDFTTKEFRSIVQKFSHVERRFGTVSSCESILKSHQAASKNHQYFSEKIPQLQ